MNTIPGTVFTRLFIFFVTYELAL